MKCPHCLEGFHVESAKEVIWLGENKEGGWELIKCFCPACRKFIFFLANGTAAGPSTRRYLDTTGQVRLVHPNGVTRPLPPEVPNEYASDFKEACNVLPESAKASAAISRRCLQHLLREKGGVKHSDLAREIQEVIDSGKLPSYLAEAIDGVRNIGNFAAHPIKSRNTGEIIDVEPGEAEWLLDTLEGLFDFYFVQPAKLQQKRATLNQKLGEAGKPPMK